MNKTVKITVTTKGMITVKNANKNGIVIAVGREDMDPVADMEPASNKKSKSKGKNKSGMMSKSKKR